MKKPQIYIHRVADWYPLYMPQENRDLLSSFADVIDDGPLLEPLTKQALIDKLKTVDAVISLNGLGAVELDAEVIGAAQNLKAIAVSHWWISFHGKVLPAWKASGMQILDASFPATEAVSEWVLGCMLMGIRKLNVFNDKLKNGDVWGEPRRNVSLLCESTVGLVGMGRIGSQVAKLAKAFGAKVIAYDPYIDPQVAQAMAINIVTMDELLSVADIISIHLPVSNETTNMIGKNELDQIKDNAILINSARSAVFNNKDLMEALQSQRFNAFLDVFEEEPLPMDHPFRSLSNVFITPHIAGDTEGMFIRCGRSAVMALKQYFEKTNG